MTKKRILIPVDTSDHSLKSVQYVAKVFSPNQTEIVIFHVYSQIEDFFSSLDISPDPSQYKMTDLLKNHQDMLNSFTEKARLILRDAGFSDADITVKMKLQSLPGIALEIQNEAKINYHAIAIGRTGISQLNEYMGNTAASLVNSIKHIPLIVVDHVPEKNKMLIAYDASESADRAVKCIAELLDDTTFDVMMYHAIKSLRFSVIGIIQIMPSQQIENEYYQKKRDEIQTNLDQASQVLIEKGLGQGQLSKKIDIGIKSRAKAMLETSIKENWGSIVVGRRGDRLVEIDIGTVGRKLVNMATDRTVWIVN